MIELERIAPDVYGLSILIVNVYAFSQPSGEWMLVDCGRRYPRDASGGGPRNSSAKMRGRRRSYRFDPAANAQRRPHDMWPHLSEIACPTLILRAELSSVISREMAQEMEAAIPNAHLVEIPGAYHHLLLDRLKEVAETLASFLL